jgi:hypothetical protein
MNICTQFLLVTKPEADLDLLKCGRWPPYISAALRALCAWCKFPSLFLVGVFHRDEGPSGGYPRYQVTDSTFRRIRNFRDPQGQKIL